MLAIVGSVCAFVFGAIDVFVFAGILVSGILAVIVAVVIILFIGNKYDIVSSSPSPSSRKQYYRDRHGIDVENYELDPFLKTFTAETRGRVTSVGCAISPDGKWRLVADMDRKRYHIDVDDIESAGAVFPKMNLFTIEGQLPGNLTFTGTNFRELKSLTFSIITTSETFSLNMVGEFGALELIVFSMLNDVQTLIFSGEELTGIKEIQIYNCRQLTNVTGVWDGDRPLLGRESFRKLNIDRCNNLPSEGIGNWLVANARKYENGRLGEVYTSGEDDREISVILDRMQNSPTLADFSELKDLSFEIRSGHPMGEFHIPSRNLAASPWSVNIGSENGTNFLYSVELFFDGVAVGPPPRNAPGTINASAANGDNHKLHIAVKGPVEKVIFKNKPAEPLTVALTKKSPLLAVEIPSLDAVPEEMLLKITNCSGEGANPGIKLKIAEQIADLWRKDGGTHFLAVGRTMDTTKLKCSGWEKMENEPNGFVEGDIVFRRANFC
jgi:hypothetical protein